MTNSVLLGGRRETRCWCRMVLLIWPFTSKSTGTMVSSYPVAWRLSAWGERGAWACGVEG